LTKICLSADACSSFNASCAIKASNNINANLSAVDVKVVIDLGELKAYEYHTGVVFCAYNEDYSKALAQGGRYNAF
jgi:ATP phosphoribosyltransferase regulatory subunit